MSSLVQIGSSSDLDSSKVEHFCAQLRDRLRGRVQAAYIFGSVSSGTFRGDSDIDLILVKDGPLEPFVRRGFEFLDLFALFPRIDLLVYTPKELEDQLADSNVGFWKSVRQSMRRIF